MEQFVQQDTDRAVKTTAWIRPSVYALAASTAQESEQPLQHWFESAVCHYASWSEELAGRSPLPIDSNSRCLFVKLLLNAPDALSGRWAALEALIRADEQLWVYPTITTALAEDGVPFDPSPRLNGKALERAWPRLVSVVFLH